MLLIVGAGWIISRFSLSLESEVEGVNLFIRNSSILAQKKLDKFMYSDESFEPPVGEFRYSYFRFLRSTFVVSTGVVPLSRMRESLDRDVQHASSFYLCPIVFVIRLASTSFALVAVFGIGACFPVSFAWLTTFPIVPLERFGSFIPIIVLLFTSVVTVLLELA
jgi:hypothetical protein